MEGEHMNDRKHSIERLRRRLQDLESDPTAMFETPIVLALHEWMAISNILNREDISHLGWAIFEEARVELQRQLKAAIALAKENPETASEGKETPHPMRRH
jgi:hypothetical protein